MNFLSIDYSALFYWLVVADNARTMFIVFIVIFTFIAVVSTICYIVSSYTSDASGQTKDDEKNQAMSRKWMWWTYPLMIIFWSLFIFTPSKRDALLIVAGGQTLNFLANDKSAKQIPHELSNFVLTEIKNLASEASVDLNIHNQKDKLLEKAKKMSAEELMTEMKKDTAFAKVILDK
jgi:hypothetical protein